MKVTHISTYDNEGGAGRAAYRLHKALGSRDIDSSMQVRLKMSDDATVAGLRGLPGIVTNKLHTWLDLLPLKFYPDYHGAPWGVSWLPGGFLRQVDVTGSDIVHLHWGCCGFIPVSALPKIRQPLVWTMHDSWAFTGGCNIPGECLRYREACGACPLLGSDSEQDLSRWEWRRKSRLWRNLPLTIIAPSRWMAECARNSSLFRGVRVEVIPNGLDINRYRPIDKSIAREILGLPLHKKLILFGATVPGDRNKGFHHLQAALQLLNADWHDRAELVIFGSTASLGLVLGQFPLHSLGNLRDDTSLVLAYSAADVMCVPSLQESFGQTASEAMACGTPVVAFAATGLLDIVDHRQNGYLARPYDCGDFAAGIEWILKEITVDSRLCLAAREKAVKEFDIDLVAHRYTTLYRQLSGDAPPAEGGMP